MDVLPGYLIFILILFLYGPHSFPDREKFKTMKAQERMEYEGSFWIKKMTSGPGGKHTMFKH